MKKDPCRDCEERHYACWDGCDKYQDAKKPITPIDEFAEYEKAKGVYYRTKYGWRR